MCKTWPNRLSRSCPRTALALALATGAAIVLPWAAAQAGTGGTEFDTFYNTIVDWAQGSLGRALALTMFIVGIAAGVIRGSIMVAVPAIGGALAMFLAPTIIDSIVTGTLTATTAPLALPAVELALQAM